jgi:hypothetical protein
MTALKLFHERGLVKRTEAIVMTAQTEEVVITFVQEFDRDNELQLVTFGKLVETEIPQSGFRGRRRCTAI